MKTFAILSGLLLSFGSSSAATAAVDPDDNREHLLGKTEQGCLFYWAISKRYKGSWKADNQSNYTWRWEGSPCRKGEFINGEGKMYTNDKYDNKLDYTGTMIDGSWHGTVFTFSEFSSPNHQVREFTMGCLPYELRKGQCTPRKPSRSSTSSGSSAPPSTSAPATTVATRDELAKVAAPPKRKLGTLKIILQVGNSCVKLKMLPYDPNYNEVHDSDRLEMRNECAVPQIVTTHIEMDDIPYGQMHYPPGLTYPLWMGKYPPKFDFLANDIRGATVMPQGAVYVQVYKAGRTLTAWIGACDAMTNNVFNRLYTDSVGAKGQISRIACVSNPEPPPKPRWPL